MRFVNQAGRLTMVDPAGRGVDLERASDGALPSDPAAALDSWPAVRRWADQWSGTGDVELVEASFGPPSPRPRQIFGVGLNYAAHAEEAGIPLPDHPMIFTKLHSSLTGPFEEITISTDSVDWEVELVVVMAAPARRVSAERAWDFVAGLTVGQDLSEREIQLRPVDTPQYSLGKSLPGFGPIGPALVTVDSLDDPSNLEVVCTVNDEEVQRARTDDLIFPIPELIAYLSNITDLFPGDLIFTGTPSGIGFTRRPPRFLKGGDTLISRIEGLGEMRHRLVAADPLPVAVGSR